MRGKNLIERSDSIAVDSNAVALGADIQSMVALENSERDTGFQKSLSES
jgi:hypothetical protein